MLITVAVCTYRRFDLLGSCLDSLKNQSIDQSKYKILVIDNSLQPKKSSSFRETLYRFENLEYVITKQCGIAFARNEALARCKTRFLAFTDDDCTTPPDWLETILSEFSELDESAAVIGGRILPMWETEQPEWLDKRLFHQLALIDWGKEKMPIYHSDGKWLLTANAAYCTDALSKTGGFPMHLGRKRKLPLAQEEFAVNQKLLELGFLMVYVPKLSVKHFISQERASKRAMLKDAFWDGVSQVLLTTHGFESNDTDKLSEKLMPLQDQLLSEIDESISGDILLEKTKEFRSKGYNMARQAIVNAVQIESYTDSVWPVVYIVTPSFNAVETIDQTILSVVTQAGDFSIRYHVQDGGSKDGTVQKLEEWKRRLTDWVNPLLQCRNIVFSYKNEPDCSMYDAISKGFKYMDIPAKAAMTWINSDDYLMPGALATVHKAFSLSEDVSWIIGAVHSCTEKSYPFACHRYVFPSLLIRAGLCDGHHWQHVQQEGTFWRKWLWDKVDGLDLSCKYAGDWDLWRRFARYCTPVQTDWPLGCFRSWPNQLSDNYMNLYNAEVENRASFTQRQNAIQQLIAKKDDINIHTLAGTTDKNYEIKTTSIKCENIPGCTWQNCSDFAATLVDQSTPTHKDKLLQKGLLSNIKSPNFSFNDSTSQKIQWTLSPLPGHSNIFFATGWHSQKSDTTGWERCCAGQGTIHIKAFKLQKASLCLTLASALKEDLIYIQLNGKEVFRHAVGLEYREFGPVTLKLKAGINIVSIHSKQASANSLVKFDSRAFVVKNVRIERSNSGFLDIRNRFALTQKARLIRKSRLFLPTYYLHKIPELKDNNQCPELHYLLYGAWENKNPNPLFDSAWYLSQYRDVYVAGENPLCHYIQHGWKEGRDPHPEFSTEGYLSNYEDVKKSGMNPLLHYLRHGIVEGRASIIKQRVTPADFHNFTYALRSHWDIFENYAQELYGHCINKDTAELKRYQDLLIMAFIKENVPPGSRLLEIGGGKSRILDHFSKDYECWNVDKLEGLGNGPKVLGSIPYKLVSDYMGNFNSMLPENYFDLAFSISALEHTPEDIETFDKIISDINRVLKPGACSLHLFDVVFSPKSFWTNGLVHRIFDTVDTINKFVPPDTIRNNPDLYVMSEEAYNRTWISHTKVSYAKHGKPSSLNILWKKEKVVCFKKQYSEFAT